MRLGTENRELRTASSGYILITLMLFITLIAMAALVVLPKMAHQVQRDREEELLHRGTEYMRAVKKYYKKFGRYPSRIEELENTNQTRFLRKRFKDPMTRDPKQHGEQDFKFVRMGDPILNNLGISNPGLGQPGIGQGPGQQVPPGIGQALGQTFGQGGGAQMVGAAGGGIRPAGPGDANTPQVTGLPGQQNSGTPGSDSEKSDTAVDAKSADSSNDTSPAPGGQVFGGGPILGVASSSKAQTIREFNKKNHYNEWVFVYDPRSDRGGLLKGPLQPNTNMGVAGGLDGNGVAPGAPGPPSPGGIQRQPAPTGPPGQQEPPDEQ